MLKTLARSSLCLLVPAALALSLTACGSSDSVDEKSSKASTTKKTNKVPAGKQGVILETGFGQRDEYVWVTTWCAVGAWRCGELG